MEKKVSEAFEEVQEREKRKLNITVSNFPKSINETPEEREKRTLQWSGSWWEKNDMCQKMKSPI